MTAGESALLSERAATVLAVDAGTTAVKAAVVTSAGATHSVERRSVTRRSPGMIDPELFWARVSEAITAAAKGCEQIDAVVVTGQGDGLWMIDADGRAPSRALEWTSRLGGRYVNEWGRRGVLDAHFRSTGTVLWSGSAAPLWRWLAEHRPDVADRTASTFCAKDWINFKLCGVVATDVSDASIPFLDMGTGRYDADLGDRLGCSGLGGRLAPIVPAGTELGSLTADAAAATGLRVGTPVLMGCLDTCALVHGACLSEPGDALAVLGTTAGVMVVSDRLDTSGDPMGASLKMNAPNRYLRCASATSGTSTLDWYLDTLHGDQSPGRLDRLWEAVGSARPGVTMLPYLAGERAPFIAPDATGAFVGLTSETTTADMARSVVMAVTMSLRHNLDALNPPNDRPLVLAGGGAGSPEWSQLVADVTGRTVAADDRLHIATGGVAALALGVSTLAHHERTIYEPQADHEREYAEYLDLIAALRPLWNDRRSAPTDESPTDAAALDLEPPRPTGPTTR